ncbi:MAG: anthranilate phosphoribosyltransferase [Candidatus Omnitrophica bacterium]|nr:anthranilate phosphoribosyltransferase [Candidatus Omnitrophota bacterium]
MTFEKEIEALFKGQDLPARRVEELFQKVGKGFSSISLRDANRVFFLFNRKGVTTDELYGAVMALRKLAKSVSAGIVPNAIDNCGTGGDGTDSFNISTGAAFVIAAAGVPVAKHGNRGVSSKCGSADLLRALGINIEASQFRMLLALKKANLGYFHAPLYHLAMKNVAPFRKSVRTKTIFNILGPLLNPLKVKKQLIGVFDKRLLNPMGEVLRRLKVDEAYVAHGRDGLDEISVTGATDLLHLRGKILRWEAFHPSRLGVPIFPLEALRGGSPAERARDLTAVFSGKGRQVLKHAIAVNAAFGIKLGRGCSLSEGYKAALDVIENGGALSVVRMLRDISNR